MKDEDIHWFVLFIRDGENLPELYPFQEEFQATEHYNKLVLNWSQVWLTKVTHGPGYKWRLPITPSKTYLRNYTSYYTFVMEGRDWRVTMHVKGLITIELRWVGTSGSYWRCSYFREFCEREYLNYL